MRNLIIVSGLLTLMAATAQAADIPTEAQQCVTCHGDKGQGTAQGPMIGGMSEQYLDAQIENFIAGRRNNTLMTLMAQSLVDLPARKVALSYFAAQGSPLKGQLRGDKIALSGAEKLYYQGDLKRGLPACYSCHGPSAAGGGSFPRLAGQQADYLAEQLIAWRKLERSGDHDNTMGHIAAKLKEDEIKSLATYLSAIQ
ncbi:MULTISPECIES: c-type cytochrome [Pseudomonas]|uniref:Cytochrome c n=1 Tax=Pseudomonas marincola TaxID=437900 RepID=A0A653E5D3_9PSED|nr:cytochrome c [Pseudomonadaceae bacterium]OEO23435.1 cytochrome c [Pseudomonas sp. J237]CAE6890252.1 Cytochrome c [Pseudomonas marincola]HCP53818.1 cytochrome c [Pseudomonas sp.]